MKICWDNLEKLRYSKKTGKWYTGPQILIYKEKCKECGEPFLSFAGNKGLYCNKECKYKSKEMINKISIEVKKNNDTIQFIGK